MRPTAGPVTPTEQRRVLGLAPRVWWAAVGTIAVVITFVSLLPPRGTPGPQIADLGEVIATTGHIVGYLLLAALIILAQRHPQPWLAWIVVTGYGALIEILQGQFALRSFQWSDIVANSLGATVGIGLAVLTRRRWAAADARLAAEEPG